MRHGFLLIDKPIGMTSHDAVAIVRNVLHERSVGHLGTLDPAASGLLVLAVGKKALKMIEFFRELPKEYEAEVVFGSVSTTYDREGQIDIVQRKPGQRDPTIDDITLLLRDRFLGSIDQLPPPYSAVHVQGVRAYELARAGKPVALTPRKVEIFTCAIVSYSYPTLHLRIRCGSGTYIRSLAHDLGQLLRCGAYLRYLRRTGVGEWGAQDAADPKKAAWTQVIPLKEILRSFHAIALTDQEFADIQHGRNIPREVKAGTLGWHSDLPVAILDPAKDGSRMAHPRKVL